MGSNLVQPGKPQKVPRIVQISLEDADYMADVVKKLVAERNRMAEALSELPFIKVYPSHSNFVLCRVIGRDAKELKLKLEQQGILVRYFNKPGLADCIRVSAGKPEHTDALIGALKKLDREKAFVSQR